MANQNQISNRRRFDDNLSLDLYYIQKLAENAKNNNTAKNNATENEEEFNKKLSFISNFKKLHFAYTVNDLISFKNSIDAIKLKVIAIVPDDDEHARKKKEAFSKLLELDSFLIDKLKDKRENLHPLYTAMQKLNYGSLLFSSTFGPALIIISVLLGSTFALFIGGLLLSLAVVQGYDYYKETKDLDAKIAEFEEDKVFWEEFENELENPTQEWIQSTLKALNDKKEKLENPSWDKSLALAVFGIMFLLPMAIVLFQFGLPVISVIVGVVAIFSASRIFYMNNHAQKVREMEQKVAKMDTEIEAVKALDSLAQKMTVAKSNDKKIVEIEETEESKKAELNKDTSVAPLYVQSSMQPLISDLEAASTMPVSEPTLSPAELSQAFGMFAVHSNNVVDVLEMRTAQEIEEYPDLIDFSDKNASPGETTIREQGAHQQPSQSQEQNRTFTMTPIPNLMDL